MSEPARCLEPSQPDDVPLQPAAVEANRHMDFAAIERTGKRFTSSVREQVQQEISAIAAVAQAHADIFWDAIKEARSNPDGQPPCYIGTRVRLKGSTLTAEWYRNRFSRDGSGGKRLYSEYIRKGASHRYSMVAFRREPLWARMIIEMIENRYAILRQRAEALGKIKRALSDYENLLQSPK